MELADLQVFLVSRQLSKNGAPIPSWCVLPIMQERAILFGGKPLYANESQEVAIATRNPTATMKIDVDDDGAPEDDDAIRYQSSSASCNDSDSKIDPPQ